MPTNLFKSNSAKLCLFRGGIGNEVSDTADEHGVGPERRTSCRKSAKWKLPKTFPYAYATGICISTRVHLPSAISSIMYTEGGCKLALK